MKKKFNSFIPIPPFSLDITIQHIGLEKRENYDIFHNELGYFVFEYAYEGEGIFIVNNKSFNIKKDSLFLIPAKTFVHTISSKTNPLKFYYIAFYGINCNTILSQIGFNKDNGVLYFNDRKVFSIFKKIYNLSSDNSINSYIQRQIQFLSLLNFLLKDKNINTQEDKQTIIVKNIQEFVHKHYSEPINVSIIADNLHLNRTYISKVFSQYYSISIIDYLIDYRLEKAKFLLTTTNKKITDIAILCGFSDNKSFYIRFKQKIGYSPKQYRSWSK